MEKQWSGKKLILFWSAFIVVIVSAVIVTEFFPTTRLLDNLYVNIVLFVIVGFAMLATIWVFVWVAVMIPYAIVKDIKEKRKVTDAKWAAYGILNEFGTVRLKRRIKHHELKRLKEIEEIMEILSKKHEDREASHLLNNLYELEQELKQIPDNEEEEDEDTDKGLLLKEMSISELATMKETYKGNPSVVKILDRYIKAKRRATKEF